MKYNNILLVVAFSGLTMSSCDDTKMEWYKDPTHGAVTSAELPLPLAEKISRYEPLKKYISDPNFKLGIGVGLDEYLTDETTATIVNDNFNDLTIGYAMKHGPMVNSKGELNFTKVDQLFEKAREAGVSIYGHCLIWHQNQNASYLNGLIADRVEITPDESDKLVNVVSNSDFETGNMTGWSAWGDNAPKSRMSAKGEGYKSDYAMVLVNPKDAASHQAQAGYGLPTVLEVGKTYCYSLMVKADVATSKFQTQVQNSSSYSGEGYCEKALIANTWTLFEGEFVCSKEGLNRLCLNFGQVAATYYIDNIKFGEKKSDPDSGRTNLLANGGFNTNKDGWSGWNLSHEGSSVTYNSDEGHNAKGCLQVVNTLDEAGAEWKIQIHSDLATKAVAGDNLYISYYIKMSSGIGSVRISTSGDTQYQPSQAVSTEWTRMEWSLAVTKDLTAINFDLGLKAGTYFIDDVVVSHEPFSSAKAKSLRSAVTRGIEYFPLSDEEKAQAISGAMKDWISKMVTHCKESVHAWDVVNEPMDDGKPSDIKSGKNKTDKASDEFYWQDYFLTPKDYAVEAFKLARQYGNPSDKLFINDYNLEYNLNKCDGLIEYVKYIESKGATVDGIGTQMHIAIDSNKDNIAQMFQKLAASGKLIKISELDIKVNTSTPTTQNLAQQAEMYQYVIDMYKKYIPEAQQYGITIWGVSDNEKEHVNWIPNDAPNLWDANYARKHAYKGVADGLAGKDVSLEFSGDLAY